MKSLLRICILLSVLLIEMVAWGQASKFLTYNVDPKKNAIRFYLKDSSGKRIGNFGRLRSLVESREGRKLLFACNAGMFRPDYNPVGLYIEDFLPKTRLNTGTGQGNFYLQPNGVFYLLGDGTAAVQTTHEFKMTKSIRFATQSGPMLVIDGAINSVFQQGSQNLNVRNGVGILPDGHVLFVMSREPVNFYDLALVFQSAGCRMALYLDGFVSKTFLPEQGFTETSGEFGVLIAVTN